MAVSVSAENEVNRYFNKWASLLVLHGYFAKDIPEDTGKEKAA